LPTNDDRVPLHTATAYSREHRESAEKWSTLARTVTWERLHDAKATTTTAKTSSQRGTQPATPILRRPSGLAIAVTVNVRRSLIDGVLTFTILNWRRISVANVSHEFPRRPVAQTVLETGGTLHEVHRGVGVGRVDASLESGSVGHPLNALLEVLHEILAVGLVAGGGFFNLVDEITELVLGLIKVKYLG